MSKKLNISLISQFLPPALLRNAKRAGNFSFSFFLCGFATLLLGHSVALAQSPTLTTTPTPLTTQIPKEKNQEIRDLVQEMVQEKIQEIKEKGIRRAYVGRITAIEGLKITLETRKGKREITIDEEAVILGPKKQKLDPEDLKTDDLAIYMGNVDSEGLPTGETGKMIAKRIVVTSKPPKPPTLRRAVFGKVAEADEEGLTLTLTSPQKENLTFKIKTTSKTRITKKVEGKIQKIKFAEIALDDRVVAVGTWDEKKEVLTAKIIHAIPASPAGGPGKALGL